MLQVETSTWKGTISAALPTIALEERLKRLRAVAAEHVTALPEGFPAFVMTLSYSQGSKRARNVQGRGATFDEAWALLETRFFAKISSIKEDVKHVRLDWIDHVNATNWSDFSHQLRDVKRNYCRRGIALDAGFARYFLEQEINANAMLYGSKDVSYCTLNRENFSAYARLKYGAHVKVDFSDTSEIFTFETSGAYIDMFGTVSLLTLRGRNCGRRSLDLRDPDALGSVIGSAARFLAVQVKETGRYIYGYHPCFDREIDSYNALRHASTTYSMLEVYEFNRDAELLPAIERALSYLSTHLIRDSGTDMAFVVDLGDEVKLGANATAILAFSKYQEITGNNIYLPLMHRLALGILFMQDADGGFRHVLRYPNLEVVDKFRIVYYEGEAAFALMRLYSLDQDPRWISCVEKAFDHFISKDYWKFHDHWLSYCANELTLYRQDLKYFEFGIRNFNGYLDFVIERITTFPTLLELMMAGRKMLDRMQGIPEASSLLSQVDIRKFDHALHSRANYLMNGHFWPEFAMFFKNPDRIIGSFFIRHHAFRVRIDDVEHYLSGLVSYLRMYGKTQPDDALSPSLSAVKDPNSVAFLMYPKSPNGFKEVRVLAKKLSRFGMNVYYCSYRTLYLGQGKMSGYEWRGGRWVEADFPQAAIIENAPARRNSEKDLLLKLKRESLVTCNPLGGKEKTLSILAANPVSASWLIPNYPFSLEGLGAALATDGKVIAKPYISNRGRGVYLFHRNNDGEIIASDNTQTRVMSGPQLVDMFDARRAKRWMLQRYIASRDANGFAFDIRVPLCRRPDGGWQAARIYARLGKGKITSNLATGGSSHDAVPFLATLYGEEKATQLVRDIERGACEMAQVLQSHYADPLDALGFDFGIAEGRGYLFEVNAYPGMKGCLDSMTDLKAAYLAAAAARYGRERPVQDIPRLDAACEANQRLLHQVMSAGMNDFSGSGFLRKGMGNPVYVMIDRAARARGSTTSLKGNTHLELHASGRVQAVLSPNSPDLACVTREIAASKQLTKQVLEAAGLPTPGGGVFSQFETALAHLRYRKRPQVAKPVRGYGGIGVTTNITDEQELRAAWARAQKRGRGVLLEDFVTGDELRLIVLGGETVAAVCRVPAYVVGDGKHRVSELVDLKNAARQKNPLMRVYPIKQFDYLEKIRGLDQNYLPSKGEVVRLATVSNVGLGGEAVSMVDVLHPSFFDLAKRAFAAFPGATQLGLDVMAKDFAADAFRDNAVIIEVNSDPAIGTPRFAAYGPPAEAIADKVVDFALARKRNCQPVEIGLHLAPSLSVEPSELSVEAASKRLDQVESLSRAAAQLGLEACALSPQILRIERGHKHRLTGQREVPGDGNLSQSVHVFWQGISERTPFAAKQASGDYRRLAQCFEAAALPQAKRNFFTADQLDQAWAFASSLEGGFRLRPALRVVMRKQKPFGPEDREAFAARWQALGAYKTLMVEAMPQGRAFQLFMIGGSLVAALQAGERGLEDEQIHPDWARIGWQAKEAVFSPHHAMVELYAQSLAKSPRLQPWRLHALTVDPAFSAFEAPIRGRPRAVAQALLRSLLG